MTNPYAPPSARIEDTNLTRQLEPVGFWMRFWATIIDGILLAIITTPIAMAIYGIDEVMNNESLVMGVPGVFIDYVLPAAVVILFWVYRQATPGKMLISARIVDADTGEKPSTGRLIIRYLGYYLSFVILCLGFLWVIWDKRKQGWHDKMANTMVVRKRN